MRNTAVFKYLFVAITFWSTVIFRPLKAQNSPTLEEIKKVHKGELAIYLKKSESIAIDIVHDSVIVTADNYAEMLHLSDNSNIFAEKTIYESKFVEISDIEAKTLSTNTKGKFETTKVTHFNTQNDMGGSIFFDDSKSINFVFPNIKEGSKSILKYKETIREPRFLNAYFFAEHIGVIESDYQVTFSSKIKIKYEVFGMDRNQLEFTETKKGNKITYQWKAKNLKGFRIENGSPNIRYYAPHIIIYVDEAEIKGQQKRYLSNVPVLYDFFNSFVKDVNLKDDPAIQKVVDSLTYGLKDDATKTKNIFYWVQDHIRYIAFEDGYGGFIPREASAVFQKRYGDCKDMASILTCMLKYANIPAYLTWVGSRHIPYTFDKNPAPSSANHMIATAKINGAYVYLDATGIYTRYGFPTDMIQGKQCLMAVNDKDFNKEIVPEIAPEKNARYDSIAISILGNTVFGKGKEVLDGYSKLDLVHPLIAKNAIKEKEILVGYLEKGNNKFFLENYAIKDLADRDKPLQMEYAFKVEDYAKKIQNEIYINLNLDKHLQHAQLDTATRQLPVERDYKYNDKFIVVMEIPVGYQLNYVPENVTYHNDLFGFSINYTVKNNTITLSRLITINTLLVEQPAFKAWNEMVSALSKAYKEVVVLKK